MVVLAVNLPVSQHGELTRLMQLPLALSVTLVVAEEGERELGLLDM
jgi:hypothetical protein